MTKIDKGRIRELHRQGMRPAKIAKEIGASRNEVEQVIKEIVPLKRKRVIIGIIVLSVCVLAVLAAYFFATRQKSGLEKNESASPVSMKMHIRQDLGNNYLTNHMPDQWIISKNAIESQRFESLASAQEGTIQRLEEMFSSNAKLPIVMQLRDAFSGHFYVSFYTDKYGGTSVNLSKEKPKADPQRIEVVLYSEPDHHRTKRTSAIAQYDSDWHALILAGLDMTKEWFQALSAHELLHALYDRQGAASAKAPMLSDLWISEELEAHGLERQVLDNVTQGKYLKLLTKIVRSKESATDLQSLYLGINSQDIQVLDDLFAPAGKSEASIRIAQYLEDLGEIWLSERYGNQVPKSLRIARYRMLSEVFSNE